MVNSGNFACAEFSEIRLTRDLGSPLGPFSNSRSFSHTLMPSSDRLDAQILGFGRWGRHRSRVGQEHLRHVGSASALDQERPDSLVELSVVGVTQVWSMSSQNHTSTALASGDPSDTSEAPSPGRSGAITW
jgi:hypothetical protein